MKEIDPICVLDFYIHESHQRSGYGKQLFDYMLQSEDTEPSQLAYDRPSPKLISFLQRHFQLTDFVQQFTNFVIFDAYFTNFTISKAVDN